jgi:hypothetical protein
MVTMTPQATVSEDEDGALRIELMNGCSLVLSPPHVWVNTETNTSYFGDWPVEEFRQWVEVALGRRDHMRYLDCACCGRDSRGPMLHDQIWRRLADEGERIRCIDCMDDRAQQRLGRALTPADLKNRLPDR